MSTGAAGHESFKLAAPGGRLIIFGSKNYHDSITTEQVRQIIWQNQVIQGFAFPALPPEKIKESVPELLSMIENGNIKIFAGNEYTLERAKDAFTALQSRSTIGKVYLRP